MDRELQISKQGVYLNIKEEKFENDKSLLENIDYTHCFETIDSHVKVEIVAHHTERPNAHSQNIANQQDNNFSGFQNTNQQGRLIKVEKFENDKSQLEDVDFTHCFETINSHVKMEIDTRNIKKQFPNFQNNQQERLIKVEKSDTADYTYNFETSDSNFQDIYGLHQNMDAALCNFKQELKVNKGRFESCENADSDLPKDSIGNSRVKIDLKPETGTFWNKESDFDLANNGSLIYMCDGDGTTRETDSSPKNGNLDLKIELNGLNVDKSELKSENDDGDMNKCVSDTKVSDFVNDKCETEDRTLSHLRKDMTYHSIEQSLKYNFSKQNFKTVEFPIMPMFHHSTETRHKCDVCEKEFNTEVNLRKHTICHRTERPHKCSAREVGFNTMVHLRRHMISHTTERPQKCNTCESGFKTMFDVRRHLASHSTELPHKYNMCEKESKYMSHVRRHMGSHTSERRHQCNMCEAGFKTMYNLRRHLAIHSTENPHKCNVCEKGFKTKDRLRSHIFSHSSERPHPCNICEKGFKTMSELNTHMASHSTDRPHKCNVCGNGFKTRRNLRTHMVIHTNERPYKCTMCENGFKSMSHLRDHMISHSINRPHKCNMCEKAYKTVKHLRRHSQSHHRAAT